MSGREVGRNAKGDVITIHEHMNEVLIAALLVASAAFVLFLSNVADFPDRTSDRLTFHGRLERAGRNRRDSTNSLSAGYG
jgi:hypothetical protein